MFEKYYNQYIRNMVSSTSLEKLVKAELLTQEELDIMVVDRLELHGY